MIHSNAMEPPFGDRLCADRVGRLSPDGAWESRPTMPLLDLVVPMDKY